LSAALVGCGSTIENPNQSEGSGATGSGATGSGGTSNNTAGNGSKAGATNGGTTNGTAGNSSGAGNGTGGSGTAGDGGGGDPRVPLTCAPGVPSTSQIPRMKNRQYDRVVKSLLNIDTLPTAPGGNPSSFLVEDSEGSLGEIAWNGYLNAGKAIAKEVMAGPNKANFINCDAAQATCLQDTIRTFGRKAFRRPVTDAEVTSLMRLNSVTPAGTPNEVAEAILYAFMVSPSFIMIPELAQEKEGAEYKLSSYEVAARLSFALWDNVPDLDLNAAADANALQTKEQILAQAQRMVADRGQTGPVVAAFHRAYADIRLGSHWDGITHDSTKFPKWTDAVRAPMMAEISAFFEEVAFNGGTFKDLFTSKVAFVNNVTAPIYGLDAGAYTAELAPVTLDDTRPGFLTRVGFLASFSGGETTSPVLRGAYIAKNVIGIRIEDPPPDAAKTPVPAGTYETQREVMEALTGLPNCRGCHAEYINPSGFILEHYDSIGGWQDTDPRGGAIDTTADVYFSDGNTKTMSTAGELMNELGISAEAKSRYAQQWVLFTTGRSANANDQCIVDSLNTKLSSEGYKILDVLADLTQADSFRLRNQAP
jgi:hypothetical protein